MARTLRTIIAETLFGDGGNYADCWHNLNKAQRQAYYADSDRVIAAIAEELGDLVDVVMKAKGLIEALPLDDNDEPYLSEHVGAEVELCALVNAVGDVDDSDLGRLMRGLMRAAQAEGRS